MPLTVFDPSVMASPAVIPDFSEFEKVMASLSTGTPLRFDNEHAQRALEDGLMDDVSDNGKSVGGELTLTQSLTRSKAINSKFLTLTPNPNIELWYPSNPN